ncbi:MAG: serine/threonine protein kinase, partial [Kofleriaceae bacterium]|nr:serine/threonine protein kinase [Kofleriaceae bacterium]
SQGAGGFEKLVIIKRIHSVLMEDKEVADTFYQEAKTAAYIEHPNVRMVYEIGNNQEHHYIALEYLEGVPLVDVLLARRKNPKLADTRFLLSLLSQACEGLHAAHIHKFDDKVGRIHGDLNPRSLFITASGTTKILDFDIARMRMILAGRHGFVRRTSAYMSPEEIQSGQSDARSDIFSLGAVAWEAVTGRRLFKRDTSEETMRAIVSEAAPSAKSVRPDITDALNATVLRALHRDPTLRFQSARDFGSALDRALLQEGTPLAPLKITAQIQSVFADKLKKQRDFVRAAREGKEQSDSLVRSYRARTEDAATVVAPPIGEVDEWESDFSVATKIVDYEDTMSAIAVALENLKTSEGGRAAKQGDPNETNSDPFQEATEFADFSDTGVAPSWGDTQNLIISSLDLPETLSGGSAASDLDSARAETRAGKKQTAKVAATSLPASSIVASSIVAGNELQLPPLPALPVKTQIVSPTKHTRGSREKGSSRIPIVALAVATVLVLGAIVIVVVRKSSSSKSGDIEAAVLASDAATFVLEVRLDSGIGDSSVAVEDASGGGLDRESDAGVRDAGAGEDAGDGASSAQAGDETGSTEAGMGTLRLSSSIRGRVYVNGKRRGRTPITISLPVGRHKIRVVPGAGKPAKTVYVEIKEGQEVRRRMRL